MQAGNVAAEFRLFLKILWLVFDRSMIICGESCKVSQLAALLL